MKPINAPEVRQRAQGAWQSILPSLGLPRESLRNQHQPCPCCGGRDRFRFDDKDGRGTFICTHYGNGGGDGFDLAMHWLQCDFQAALKAVAGVLGMEGNPSTKISKMPAKATVMRVDCTIGGLARLSSIWNRTFVTDDFDAFAAYLHHRGLSADAIKGFCADSLRFHPALPYWRTYSGQPHCVGHFPSMVGNITDEHGQMQGLHLTYLQAGGNGKLALCGNDGQPLPAKKMRSRFAGSLKGCAIRLFAPENGALAVCEGIETALAVRQSTGLPVWACLSANGLQSLVLPAGVRELFIYCDNDHHGQGYRAGHALALRAIKTGIKCRLWQPQQTGFDALDVLNQKGGAT